MERIRSGGVTSNRTLSDGYSENAEIIRNGVTMA